MKKKIFKVLIQILCFSLALEAGVRILSLDISVIYLNRAIIDFSLWLPSDIHAPSANSKLLYELKPNLKLKMPAKSNFFDKDAHNKFYNLSTNSFGFRNPEFEKKKKPGVFRVFFVGASNTFGMVDDEHTYPAQLQKNLQNKFKNTFEIINAGISGTVLSQRTELARQILLNFEPDLIFIQNHNSGKRSFAVNDKNIEYHFKNNSELYRENIPSFFQPEHLFSKFHYFLIDWVAAYRTFAAITWFYKLEYKCVEKNDLNGVENCFYNSIKSSPDLYVEYANELGRLEFEKLVNEYPRFNFIILNTTTGKCERMFDKENPNVYHFSFCNTPADPEFSDMHPRAHVYAWYAEQIEEVLLNFYEKKTSK